MLHLREGDEKCIGFNYRTTKDVENCQLTNVTDNKSNSNKGDWILMREYEAVCAKFQLKFSKTWLDLWRTFPKLATSRSVKLPIIMHGKT